jgi:hypothetical protein
MPESAGVVIFAVVIVALVVMVCASVYAEMSAWFKRRQYPRAADARYREHSVPTPRSKRSGKRQHRQSLAFRVRHFLDAFG